MENLITEKPTSSQLPAQTGFTKELYFEPQQFAIDLANAIESSQKTIDIEMYIWANDELGNSLFNLLKKAANRGVTVRLLLDGWGSSDFVKAGRRFYIEENVQIQVYNPIPRILGFVETLPDKFYNLVTRLNRRSHRKIFLIDGLAYVGSFNILKESLDWRENIVRVPEKEALILQDIFNQTWISKKSTKSLIKDIGISHLHINQSRMLRKQFNHDFLYKLILAQKRIWLMTPYFNPPSRMLRALARAAKRGVDVRLILPAQTDINYISWMSKYYYKRLIRNGVKIFEYQPKILHAKAGLIDDCAIVGSANLNYRSFFKDLEINIDLVQPDQVSLVEKSFLKDFENSLPIQNKNPFNIAQRLTAPLLINYKRLF